MEPIFRARLAAVLTRARLTAGLTQQQLADAVGVHRMTVHRWERAQRLPDAYQLALLAATYGQPLELPAL